MPSLTLHADRLIAAPNVPEQRGVTIEIAGEHIVRVEPARALGTGSTPRRRRLVLPSLANAHDHARVARNTAVPGFERPLEAWLFRLAMIPAADPWLCSAVSFARSALGGVGAIMVHYTRVQTSDIVAEAGQVIKALRDVGLRGAFAVQCRDRNPIVYGPEDRVLAAMSPAARTAMEKRFLKVPLPAREQVALVEVVAAAHEGKGVAVQFGPAAVQWCSDALLRLIAERSAATGRRVHMHMLESKYQRVWADREYPQGIMRYLDEIGLLSPRLSLAHCVWTRADELELLAERGVTIVVNTSSNLTLRSGRAAIDRMLAAGVRVAMGLDGCALDEDEDALRELRLNYALNKGTGFDVAMRPADALAFATANGRFALDGSTGAGEIAPGRDADCLALDLDALTADALVDEPPVKELLLARASRAHVSDLIVAGRHVVKDGRIAGLDLAEHEAELMRQLRKGMGATADLTQALPEVAVLLGEHYQAYCGCG
jgi:cytosine/adenosine deaminase-related metal-dependent hydrolase